MWESPSAVSRMEERSHWDRQNTHMMKDFSMNTSAAMKRRVCLTLWLIVVGAWSLSAQILGGGGEAHPDLKTNKTSLEKWQEMRFGMFIHWGPVTLRGTEIGWSRGPQVPIQEYDNLYKEFNPVLYNAKEWVSVAKSAGMKYLVITSKHHDGFCLWDTKYTDYKITSTPYRKDVLRQLSGECDAQGIMFCTYYSILDWHHPDYTTRYGGDTRPVEQSDMSIYKEYLKNQIAELVRNYHTHLLWFDGQWEKSWTHEDGMDLYAYARSLDDALLINNRVDKGRTGGEEKTGSLVYAGDFGTPEQTIGALDNRHPWESCITIGGQWSWKPNDNIKAVRECIHILAKTAGGGGNLLLNISPMPDGRLEQRQIDRLRGIGAWLGKYGESIYGTHGGPFKPTAWSASTCKGSRIYVHVLTPPADELRLPLLPNRTITGARMLSGGDLPMKINEGQVILRLPGTLADTDDNVIVLELDGPADGVEPLDLPPNVFKELDSSRIRLKNPPSPTYYANGAKSLLDNVRGTSDYLDGRWLGFEQDDLEAVVDLQTRQSISRVVVGCLQTQVSWIFYPREIEVAVSDNGTDFTTAGKLNIGEPKQDDNPEMKDFTVSFETTQARYVRVKASNVGTCPPWHYGAGGKAWIFSDEIIVE
jgi:alpha-L-fucosidase